MDTTRQLLTIRADLHARYTLAKEIGDERACDEIGDAVDELDTDLRGAGVRGRLAPLDPEPARARRSTRRRQDALDLPRRLVEQRTLGRVTVGVKDDGKPDRRHVMRRSRADVLKVIREVERQRDGGSVRAARRVWTVGEWLTYWGPDLGYNGR